MNNEKNTVNIETKICKKCGRILPVDKFRLVKGQFNNPYYLGQCKECEYKYQRAYLEKKNKIEFSDDLEILTGRLYKEVNQKRILNISGLDITPLKNGEIFVRLMDYKNAWLSNYGRVVKYVNNEYKLLKGGYDANGSLRYSLRKNVFVDGKWTYKSAPLYAAQAVVDEFVVNPDKLNNVYIWHKGYDKQDCYYKNLYPLNQNQYKVVKNHFNKTGDDSEDFIIKVMNDIMYKPDDWSRRDMSPTVCGIGYHGSSNVDCKSEEYIRWHDMMNRCYNKKFHERQPQYRHCAVCPEWHNFMNFKVWYNKNKYGNRQLDLDKDILFKGNFVYAPDTVAFVPHAINTLFVDGKSARGGFPVGVYYDKDKGKYRALMSFMGRQIKLGWFDTAEDAFARYKEYKEDFIKDIAEQYRDEIPDKVYNAMINWKIEVDD